MDKKELGAYKKMSPEDVQGMLHLRRRAHKQKNKKAYNRKKKHKESVGATAKGEVPRRRQRISVKANPFTGFVCPGARLLKNRQSFFQKTIDFWHAIWYTYKCQEDKANPQAKKKVCKT